MPLAPDEIRCDVMCGVGPDGRRRGWIHIQAHPDALRRLGLHPDQPTAAVVGPSPPGWWHAAAERHAQK
ncbi:MULTISPECIES: hypothetical protein [unclassified Streptomyces]|uniref:hypothetical protein n=1 Tax=unclassified Streptomyces TaxID=2593676 RepID=UPI00336A47C1